MVNRHYIYNRTAARIVWSLAFLLTSLPTPSVADNSKLISSKGLLGLEALVSDIPGWPDLDTFAFANNNGDVQALAQAGISGVFRLKPALTAKSSLIIYSGSSIDVALTESYLFYKPVPQHAWRYSIKMGMFYPPLSLENNGPLWTSPSTPSPSTINTWIGEELRTLGAQWTVSLPAQHNPSNWNLAFFAALYGFNDTTGAMLTWRGWTSHSRQAGFGNRFSIDLLPNLKAGRAFEHQDGYFEPFVEVDNRAGFYWGGQTTHRDRRLKFNYVYYDNQGDPGDVKKGQYSWRTRFQHIGFHWRWAGNMALLGQYLNGDTKMGIAPGALIDADYWSGYLMLTKRWQQHRLALRWDRFEVIDNDNTLMDSNSEHGRHLTVSYSRHWHKTKASISYTNRQSLRPGRSYAGRRQPVFIDAAQWELSLRQLFF